MEYVIQCLVQVPVAPWMVSHHLDQQHHHTVYSRFWHGVWHVGVLSDCYEQRRRVRCFCSLLQLLLSHAIMPTFPACFSLKFVLWYLCFSFPELSVLFLLPILPVSKVSMRTTNKSTWLVHIATLTHVTCLLFLFVWRTLAGFCNFTVGMETTFYPCLGPIGLLSH